MACAREHGRLIALRSASALAFSLGMVLLCGGVMTVAAQTVDANPGRPTVSNPATLVPVGYLQFEQGYLGSLTSPETAAQYGANQVTKLAVVSRVLVQVQTQPFAFSREVGATGSSAASGDVLLGAQGVLWGPVLPASGDSSGSESASQHKFSRPTFSLGYLGRVHAGSTPDIDQGGYAQSALLLVSGDVGGFHYDTNYLLNEQTADEPSNGSMGIRTVRRAQFAQTLSVNHGLGTPRLQLAAEIYHFTQPLVGTDDRGRSVARANLVDGLMALSYTLRGNLVLDGGFSHGFTSTSTRWQSFAGFTYLLPKRLWRGGD
ncbi:MAG TPA: transporter [Acidobacteriaceae bacterium]|nr:transporter [Acidobacteriaceae bacterium]